MKIIKKTISFENKDEPLKIILIGEIQVRE